jgi:general L-amino acid transport system permease protein
VQAIFGAFVVLLLLYAASRAVRLDLDFGFLRGPAGFSAANDWVFSYQSNESRFAAYLVGVWNTVRLVAVGIALATLLGVAAGMARLSGNWLVARLAALYVETIRNTPLLVQIVFWWLAVFLALPQISEQRNLFGVAFISNRAIALPWLQPTGLAALWVLIVAGGLAAGWLVRQSRLSREERSGQPSHASLWGAATVLAVASVGFVATGLPLEPTTPEIVTSGVNIQRYEGGLSITPQFAALLIALVTYTGTFIAEIVRGSIQALPKGQSEAAAALGLSAYQRMALVVLPQALRTMIPPLTNQYLSLNKNSSLAIFIGYSELFLISTVVINNAGHAVPMFVLVIATYQVLNLLISAAMNYLNSRVQLVGS